MKTAKQPGKSWSKVAAAGSPRPLGSQTLQEQGKDAQFSSSKQNREKLLALLANLVDSEAEVATKGGLRYRGIVKSVSAESELGVVLREVKQIQGTGTAASLEEISISPGDLVEVYAARLGIAHASAPKQKSSPQSTNKSTAWKTDTDISGRTNIKERVLQAWQPPANDNIGGGLEHDLGTPSKAAGSSKPWDQFAANEKLFGVKSQWDEDLYTHKLDTSRPDFAERRAEAEKLAREIEQTSSTNAHVLEERGIVDDSGLTEEDKYSGVQRNPDAWIPPARRPANKMTMENIDPAIISSQLAKPGSPSVRSIASSLAKSPRTGKNDPSQAENASTPTQPTQVNTIETDIMTRFKQFATNERDRLSVRKAATFKKEKDGRLQDLLAFSKDFKLNTPVPEDLIPILAKDKAKQNALVQKAASSATSSPSNHRIGSPTVLGMEEVRLPDTLRSRVDQARQTPASQAVPSPVPREPSTESKKLKPSAAEFKPFNPAASSFTPTFAARVPPSASPALSSGSGQARQPSFSVEAAAFFPRRPRTPSSRSPILEQFNPFKTYRQKHPESNLDIETPLKVDPSWPSENTTSISDAPQDLRPEPQFQPQQAHQQQFQSVPGGSGPQLMYLGSPQQALGYQQGYYGKQQQYMPVPPGQFVSYHVAPNYVQPQYMYPASQAYNPRAVQAQMVPVPFTPQSYNNFVPNGSPQLAGAHFSQNSAARSRQTSVQRSPELQKPVPRPPPSLSTETKKDEP